MSPQTLLSFWFYVLFTHFFSCKGILSQCILNPCSLYLNILPLNICMVNSLISFNSCSNVLSMELNCRAPLLNSSPNSPKHSILLFYFSHRAYHPLTYYVSYLVYTVVCILYLNVSSRKAALFCFHLFCFHLFCFVFHGYKMIISTIYFFNKYLLNE